MRWMVGLDWLVYIREIDYDVMSDFNCDRNHLLEVPASVDLLHHFHITKQSGFYYIVPFYVSVPIFWN